MIVHIYLLLGKAVELILLKQAIRVTRAERDLSRRWRAAEHFPVLVTIAELSGGLCDVLPCHNVHGF